MDRGGKCNLFQVFMAISIRYPQSQVCWSLTNALPMVYAGLASERHDQSCLRRMERTGRHTRNDLFVPSVIDTDIYRKALPVSGDWPGYGYGGGDIELVNTDRDLVVENH
jgi:hypothetical protein